MSHELPGFLFYQESTREPDLPRVKILRYVIAYRM